MESAQRLMEHTHGGVDLGVSRWLRFLHGLTARTWPLGSHFPSLALYVGVVWRYIIWLGVASLVNIISLNFTTSVSGPAQGGNVIKFCEETVNSLMVLGSQLHICWL